MSVTQTVDIPVNRKLTINVPREVPAGKTILTFKPIESAGTGEVSIKTLRGTLHKVDTSDLRDEFDRSLILMQV